MPGVIQSLIAKRQRLKNFRDIHSGQRAFVIGNGPSLNEMDLAPLAQETTFTSNGFYHLFSKIDWRPDYYACVDAVVLRNQMEPINQMREDSPSIQCFFPEKIPDVYIAKRKIQVETILPNTPKTCYFKQIPPDREKKPFGMFPKDPASGLVQPYTVTATLLQLAHLMGCNPIYLIGCDNHYQPYPGVKTVDDLRPNATTVYEAGQDNDPNHFHPAYFGQGKRFHEPNADKMAMHYEAIHEAADILALEIYNAGLDSRLECFPKVDFKSLFR